MGWNRPLDLDHPESMLPRKPNLTTGMECRIKPVSNKRGEALLGVRNRRALWAASYRGPCSQPKNAL